MGSALGAGFGAAVGAALGSRQFSEQSLQQVPALLDNICSNQDSWALVHSLSVRFIECYICAVGLGCLSVSFHMCAQLTVFPLLQGICAPVLWCPIVLECVCFDCAIPYFFRFSRAFLLKVSGMSTASACVCIPCTESTKHPDGVSARFKTHHLPCT